MGGEGYQVGVDFGTSNTAAVLSFPDGRMRPLLFEGSPLLPSAVFADPSAGLLVGRDATHAARTRPDCFEPHPKRCVDDGTVLLGGRPVPVPEMIRAVARRVAGEAARVAGGPVSRAVFTCPAGWGAARREVLLAAARVRRFCSREPETCSDAALPVGHAISSRPSRLDGGVNAGVSTLHIGQDVR